MNKKIALLLIAMIFMTNLSCLASYEPIQWDFTAVEAEDLIESSFSVAEDKECSMGKVAVSQVNSTDASSSAAPDIRIKFTARSKCKYSIYVRVKFSGITDSYLYGYNNSSYTAVYSNGIKSSEGSPVGRWIWWRETVPLEPGENIIKFRSRRTGVAFDKIIITNHPMYFPYGIGQDCADMDIYSEKNAVELYESVPAPPYVPSPEHPRVFVNKNDIPRIRESINHPTNQSAYNAIINYSKIDPSVCILPPNENGATSNYNTQASAFIYSNAFLYLINEDKEAGRKAIEGSVNYVKTLDTLYAANSTYVSRNENSVLQSVAKAYDWCYDLMSEDEKKTIIDHSILQLTCGETGWPPLTIEHAYDQGHWSEIDIMNTQLALGIAFYDECPDFYNIIGGYIFSDFVTTRNFLYENSKKNVIGTGYGREIYEIYMAILLDKMGAKNVIADDFRYWMYMPLYEGLPVGGVLQDGDGTHVPGNSNDSNAGVSFFFANLYNDPLIKRKAYDAFGQNVTYIGSPDLFIIMNNTELDFASQQSLPLSVYSGPLTGSVVARTGWDEDTESDDMIAVMKTPENFFTSHAHYDSGSFQIYYKGMLALDSGVYRLYNNEHHRYYYTQSIAHNTMLIYNPDNDQMGRYPQVNVMGGQTNSIAQNITSVSGLITDSKIGQVLGVDFGDNVQTPAFSYLKGDITGAYNGNADNYTRSFVFFNFFDEVYPGALIVFDKVTANKSYKRTYLLHSQNEPEISGNTQVITRTDNGYNGKLINETLLPQNVETTKIGGEGYEYYVDGKNRPDNKLDDSGNWRIEISPKNNMDTDYFLNVMQVSDNNEAIKPLESKLYDAGTHYGVKIKDRAAFLSKSEKRTARTVELATDGSEETLLYMVDGLKEGTWRIFKDGIEYATKEADARGGVINFEGPVGNYRIAYLNDNYTPKPLPLEETNVDAMPDRVGIGFKVNGLFKNTFANPIRFNEEDAVIVPIDEYMKKIGLADCITCDEIGYHLNFMGNKKDIPFEQLENINGVYYVNPSYLDDVLKTKCSYNSYSEVYYVQTLGMATQDSIVNSDAPNRIKVKQFVCEGYSSDSKPKYAVDGNELTNFGHGKIGTTLDFEFEKEETLKSWSIKWYVGDSRSYKYRILISVDGENYTEVYNGRSSGTNADFESVVLEAPVKAKYLRLIGEGNSVNAYTNFYEIQFYK